MELLSLPILVFSPILIIFVMLFVDNETFIRRFAKGFQSVHFIYALCFLAFFQNSDAIQFSKELTVFGASWIAPLNIKLDFGIDGISLVMVLLTSFVFLLALIASKNNIKERQKFYYIMIMLLQTAVLGVFCARDMFLFFLFWELELVPMYFLISQWGSGQAKKSAMKFVLYTFIGSLFMLLALLLIHFYNFALTGTMTSDMSKIFVNPEEFPQNLQIIISIFLLFGFGVKIPIVPLHTWLPAAHTDAPTPVSMILAALLLKMGVYGIIRFNMQIMPDAFVKILPVLLVLAVVNIIFFAVLAYHQTDLKKIVAYSSISNMGIVLLGVFSLDLTGFVGGVFHMLSHGLISAGLFMLVGAVYLRTKTRDITQLGGLGQKMPRLMAFGTLLALAAVGVPLLMGFVGEFLSIFGAFNSDIVPIKLYALCAVLVLLLSLCYVLRLLHKTFFSNIFEQWKSLEDIRGQEVTVFMGIALSVAFFGLFPMSIINIILPTLTTILEGFGL